VSVKAKLVEHVPDSCEWCVAIYDSDECAESYRSGISDQETVRLLRKMAEQVERGIIPDPDSGTQH
jgi:hypothetical protein